MATWERLAHAELSSGAATIDTGTFTAYENLMIQMKINAANSIGTRLRVNNDSGTNYSMRTSSNGGSDGTSINESKFSIMDTSTSGQSEFYTIFVQNEADKEKLFICEGTSNNGNGAGNAPRRRELAGKWANTSSNITQVNVVDHYAGSNFAAGSYITVWGINPAPVTADVITVDSLEAKKHLMVQGNLLNSGSLNTVALQFNSDTGNNYSRRYSVNGGADATDTSQPSLEIEQGSAWSGDCFFTAQIINEAAKEKLVQSEWIDQQSTGAGSAPRRAEVVGKWSNTSNAITTIKVIQDGSGSFAEGSEVTVYGTD